MMASSAARAQPFVSRQFITLDVVLIVMLAFFSQIGLAVLSPNGDADDAKGLIFRAYFYIYMLSGVGVIAMGTLYGLKARSFTSGLVPCALLFGACAVSIVVSVDKAETFNHLIRLFIFLAAVVIYTQVRGPHFFVRSVLILVIGVNVASTLVSILLPDIGVHHAADYFSAAHVGNWRGITSHKNELGRYACAGALSLMFFPNILIRLSVTRYLMLASCLANLIMAQSSSNFVAFAGCLAFYLVCMHGRVTLFRLIAGPILLGLAAYGVVQAISQILDLLGKDASLSGRAEIWSYCMALFHDHPLFGYGYSAGAEYARERMQVELFAQAVDAHSFYIQTLLDVGLVGLMLILAAIIRAIWVGLYTTRHQPAAIVDANRTMVIWIVWGLLLGLTEIAAFSVDGDSVATTLGSLAAIGGVRMAKRRTAPQAAAPLRPAPGFITPSTAR